MTNADRIIIVARYEAFVTETAKDLGVLSGGIRETVKEYKVLRKELYDKRRKKNKTI